MRALFSCLLVLGCSVDFEQRKQPDSDMASRIARKQSEVLQSPSDVEKRLQLGALLLEGEQWFEAADAFLQAKNQGSNDIRVHAGLTTAYYELGYMTPMVESLKSCIQMDRSNPECLFAYAKLIEPDRSERAQEELRRVFSQLLMVSPNFRKAPYVRSSLKQLDAKLGPPKEPVSRAASQPAKQDQPDKAASQPVPGHPGGAEGDTREDVGELNPFGRAISEAIQAVQSNDAVTAEAAFRRALVIRPKDPGATAGLAETLFAQNKQAEAVKTIEHAYALDKTDAQVRWAFGLIMIQNKKRLTEALAGWEALNNDDPEYAKRLGIPERLAVIKKFMKGAEHAPPQ